MPELPEVETTRQGILPHVGGRRVIKVTVRQTALRWPIPAELPKKISRYKLRTVHRRGKYLLFEFSHGHLLIHLGMSGSLRIVNTKDLPQKHDHIDIEFAGNICLRFHDPRRFGSVLWTEAPVEEHALIKNLGPEPLSDHFTGDYLFERSRKRSKDIKSFIMDSHIVVGVGNIYANESLFMASIRPIREAGKVSKRAYKELAVAIKEVLQRSIDQGGTTLRDFVGGDGKPGYFAQQLMVYGREGLPCKRCGKPLKATRQSQRISVFCAGCQS